MEDHTLARARAREWKNPAWIPAKSGNPPPDNLAPGYRVGFGHTGYWADETRDMPDEIRWVNGKKIIVRSTEFTGKRVWVKATGKEPK